MYRVQKGAERYQEDVEGDILPPHGLKNERRTDFYIKLG